MLYGQVFEVESECCLVEHVSIANNAWERARGLLARKRLEPHQGFWLEPCPSVHTLGMHYSLDIIFLDNDGWVKKIVSNLKPLRIASCFAATSTLELLAGQAESLEIKLGMQLNWKEKSSQYENK